MESNREKEIEMEMLMAMGRRKKKHSTKQKQPYRTRCRSITKTLRGPQGVHEKTTVQNRHCHVDPWWTHGANLKANHTFQPHS